MTKKAKLELFERIYIDANVLINYCTMQRSDCVILRLLFSNKSDAQLYTSDLAIVQTIAKLQSKTKYRNALPLATIKKFINYFYAHIDVLEANNEIISKALRETYDGDIEDAIHYYISQSVNCNVILTNNKKDYDHFEIAVRTPRKIKSRKNK